MESSSLPPAPLLFHFTLGVGGYCHIPTGWGYGQEHSVLDCASGFDDTSTEKAECLPSSILSSSPEGRTRGLNVVGGIGQYNLISAIMTIPMCSVDLTALVKTLDRVLWKCV